MDSSNIKVVVTGASGFLGRAVLSEAQRRGLHAVGMAHTRASGGLAQVDLLDAQATGDFIAREAPQCIIHCAAEKRPAAVEHSTQAHRLNVEVPALLARLAQTHNAYLIYVSTEYVFDGTSPPYEAHDAPNPLNKYGLSKLQGEHAALANAGAAVLRLPLLYGRTVDPAESQFGALVQKLCSGARLEANAWQKRYPTSTEDVARVLIDMSMSAASAGWLSGIYQFASQEMLTQYTMCEVLKDILGSASEIVPLTHSVDSVVRPEDTRMSVRALEEAGINVQCTPFRQWWTTHLQTL
ncbi:hypothetical protein BX070DRAFT_196623 [Coemansia spiralis]|nr:hypothetical protein BX070DRAFT_196623 [Coemansia spiralis]